MLYRSVRDVYSAPHWKRGRAVEGTGLENRRPERVLEFESLRFRQILAPSNFVARGFFVPAIFSSVFPVPAIGLEQ